MNIFRAMIWGLLLLPLLSAADDTASALSQAQKDEIARMQAETAVLQARSANLKAQTELRAQELAARTPTTGQDVTALSGKVEGAKELDMALYIAAMHSLRQVVPQVCKDLSTHSSLMVTASDVSEAVMRTKTLDEMETEYTRKANLVMATMASLTKDINEMMDSNLIKPTSEQLTAKAASLSGAAALIDAGAGLTKGVIGLASLFKSEVTLTAVPNLVTNVELESMLHCEGKLNLLFVDQDYQALDAAFTRQSNKLLDVITTTSKVRPAADALRRLRAEVQGKAKQKDQTGRTLTLALARVDAALAAADSLVIAGRAYVDAFYVADPTTGVAPLAVAAKYRRLHDLVILDKYEHLQFTVQRSGGYTMTKRRALFNDKVAYAGGIALRTAVMARNGRRTHDKVYYAQTGWIPVDFDVSAAIPLTNVDK